MDRFEDLERTLWQAHGSEAAEAMFVETRDAQEAHTAERVTLASSFRQRGHRLAEACRRQVRALRQEHDKQVAELSQTALTLDSEDGAGEREPCPTPAVVGPLPSAGVERAQSRVVDDPLTTAIALSGSGAFRWPTGGGRPHEPRVEKGGEAKEKASRASCTVQSSISRRVMPSAMESAAAVPAASRVAVAPAARRAAAQVPATAGMAAADRWRRSRELVELNDELGRHLTAVEHVLDGSRHLAEATRVMREIEKLKARERLEAETRARGVLGVSPEKASILQKHAQAEQVQGDKHDRVLRALYRSGTEEFRLLSVRQSGNIARLSALRRDKNRRRKSELRGKLAALRGAVAREWRAHNARSRGFRRSSGSGGKSSKGRLPLWRCADAREDAGRETRVAAGGGKASCFDQPRQATARKGEDASCDAVIGERKAGPGVEAGGRKGGGPGMQSRQAAGWMPSDGVVSCSLAPERELEAKENDTACRIPLRPLTTDATADKAIVGEEARTPFARRSDDGEIPKVGARAGEIPSYPLPGPSATSATSANKKSFKTTSTSRGGPLKTRRNRVAAKAADWRRDVNPAAAPAGTFEVVIGGAFGVLSEEEVRALEVLGRGAPTDPRLLLLATPPAPPPQWRQEQPEQRGAPSVWIQGNSPQSAPKQHQADEDSLGRTTGRYVRGGLDEVLERAADKLARKIQAEEDSSRRRLGMAPRLLA
ncbi:unnamed protein product [Scytosiphon promiscuus]